MLKSPETLMELVETSTNSAVLLMTNSTVFLASTNSLRMGLGSTSGIAGSMPGITPGGSTRVFMNWIGRS